jgi:hypothetical protein
MLLQLASRPRAGRLRTRRVLGGLTPAAVVFVATALVASACGGTSPSSVSVASAAAAASASPAPIDAPSVVHRVLEPVVIAGGATATVVRVEDWHGDAAEQPPPGKRFLAVYLRIASGASATSFDARSFRVGDASGNLWLPLDAGRRPLLGPSVALRAGEVSEGYLTFVVPPHTDYTLSYCAADDTTCLQPILVDLFPIAVDPTEPSPTPVSALTLVPTPMPTSPSGGSVEGVTITEGAGITTTYYAGYSVSLASGSFTAVTGRWAQPAVTCDGLHWQSVSVWVGIDDDGEKYLEQTGTGADCKPGDRNPTYYAWYEMFPAPMVPVTMKVQPGDEMAAAVTVTGTNFTLHIANMTTGKSVTVTKSQHAKTIGAYWIVEAPSTVADALHVLSLPQFAPVTMTDSTATARGITGPIANPGWAEWWVWDMASSTGTPKASTSALDQAGTVFTVKWRHS